MTLLLATHHHSDRIQNLVAGHDELSALPKRVAGNRLQNREAVDVFSLDPLRKRRDIGMFYDAALDCGDDLLLCLNDDVLFIAPELDAAHLAARMGELEVIYFQPNLAAWASEADLDESTQARRAVKERLFAHGRRVRFARTHAFLCRRDWLLRAFERVADTHYPAQAFEKSTLRHCRYAFAQPLHLIVDSNTLPYIQHSLPASLIDARWLPLCPDSARQPLNTQ